MEKQIRSRRKRNLVSLAQSSANTELILKGYAIIKFKFKFSMYHTRQNDSI